jgi:hypothetical protein
MINPILDKLRISDVFSNYDEPLLCTYIKGKNLYICFNSASKKSIIISEEISMIFPNNTCEIKMGRTLDRLNCRVIIIKH